MKKVAIRIEDRLRATPRSAIEAVLDEELDAFLGGVKYGRRQGEGKGDRHGRRERPLTSTLGTETGSVPCARLQDGSGHTSQWRSRALGRYQPRTHRMEAWVTSACLAGSHTRREKKTLFVIPCQGAISKDVVSRAWRKVRRIGKHGAAAWQRKASCICC